MNVATVATLVGVAIGGGGIAGGVTSVVMPLIRRPSIRADAAQKLSDAAALVNEIQEEGQGYRQDASAARREAVEARREATEARRECEAAQRQMQELAAQAEGLAVKLRSMIAWIHDPGMSMERLRAMIPARPTTNGTTNY